MIDGFYVGYKIWLDVKLPYTCWFLIILYRISLKNRWQIKTINVLTMTKQHGTAKS